MAFGDIFEEQYWDFESIMSILLGFLGNYLFPEENVTEKHMQQSVSERT